MRKCISLTIILISFALNLLCLPAWSQTENVGYAESLKNFLESYRAQVQVIYPTELRKMGVSELEVKEIYLPPAEQFLAEIEKKVERLADLHHMVFIEAQRDKSVSSEMNRIESNLTFVSEVGIRNILHILLDYEKAKKRTNKIKTRLKHLNLLANELASGEEIKPKSRTNLLSLLDIRQTVPSQMFRIGCSYVANVCIRRQPISDWLQLMGEKGYAQRGSSGFIANNFEKAQSLPSNAVVIVVSNHQDGSLDVMLPAQFGEKLGLNGGLKLLAHSSNYPLVQFMNQGENLVFTDRGDWQKEALDSIESEKNQNRRIGLLVYPEGLVSGPLSQFPLITKVGALSAARKWAHRFEGKRPVYLAVLTTDAHEFNTREEFKPLHVNLESLELVPTEKPVVPDSWIVNKREEIENRFNEYRTQMADLETRKKTPGMHGLYETTRVLTCPKAIGN